MELDKLILKFIWKNKHARIAKETLKNNKLWRESSPARY